WSRAARTCECCRMPQSCDPLPFGIDHVKVLYHHGPTSPENLALACFNCNTFKASNAAGYDPGTGELTRLFNPRTDEWSQHFAWAGPELIGSTPVGRRRLTCCESISRS